MNVVYYDPYQPNGYQFALGVRRAETLAELMGQRDFVSIHTLLTAEIRKMIGAEALAALKPGVIVINAARGPIVDTDTLYDAVKARTGHRSLSQPLVPPTTRSPQGSESPASARAQTGSDRGLPSARRSPPGRPSGRSTSRGPVCSLALLWRARTAGTLPTVRSPGSRLAVPAAVGRRSALPCRSHRRRAR